MTLLAAPMLPVLLCAIFLCGSALGALVNWAVYRWAWQPRDISPWGPTPDDVPSRRAVDRLPIVGWWFLRRESGYHGAWFWIRPLLIEVAMGLGLAVLFWWEVPHRGLLLAQLREQLDMAAGVAGGISPIAIPEVAVWPTFISHVLLIVLMAAASFIDIDEKIIPDEITVPGTLLGLLLAACLPMALLPQATTRLEPQPVHVEVELPPVARQLAAYVEPVTLNAPNPWPEDSLGAGQWPGLVMGQLCWWFWCVALTPRIWRGRRGLRRGLAVISRRIVRELRRPPLGVIAVSGALAIAAVWWLHATAWLGLLTALAGLAVSGSLVWVVRLVGTAALGREAMGFGDVTLMMMIGAFLGWQACVVIFFVAPLAGVLVGVFQAIAHQDDVIPYGPFLCLGALGVIVFWAPVWNYVYLIFQVPWLVPAVLLVCFVLLGLILAIWQQFKRAMFGS